MKKIETKTGFKVSIDEKVLDNMELVDALDEVEGNPVAISRVVALLLGKDNRKKLYDHLRTKDGRVPVEAVTNETIEIMELLGDEAKN